jgi:hypothetical protein
VKIVSGDRHLLTVSVRAGVEVIRPREFVEKYIKDDVYSNLYEVYDWEQYTLISILSRMS